MKGTTNAQRNAVVGSSSAVDKLTLTMADGTTQQHTVSDMIPKDTEPTKGSAKFVTSGAIKTALDAKVSTETGKGLSTNDYTTAEKSKVSNLPDNANNTFATKTELTNAVSSVYKYKGTKATYSALPASGNTTGDVWNVTAANGNIPAGTNYAWNGSAWDALGGEIDLTGYVPTSRTVNGKALTGNITLAASDVSAVPTTRKVNNKALSADITLTAGDVGALATNGTAAKATADASGNNIVNTYATKTELTNGLAGKQNNLTFDSAPTSGSSNPVTSGGVYSAINTVNTSISSLQSLVANKQDKLTFDTTPTSGSSNPITSGGVYTAINDSSSSSLFSNYISSKNSTRFVFPEDSIGKPAVFTYRYDTRGVKDKWVIFIGTVTDSQNMYGAGIYYTNESSGYTTCYNIFRIWISLKYTDVRFYLSYHGANNDVKDELLGSTSDSTYTLCY